MTQIEMTRERWERIKSAAAEGGLRIDGDSGHAERDGVLIAWNFDGGRLDVECVDKPRKLFFMSKAKIEAKVREELEKL